MILGGPGQPPLVVGHRGFAAAYPENTLVGVGAAFAAGADAVEFDVRLAADGVPVVIHDALLNRTTSGNGLVAEHSSTKLADLDAGAWFAEEFAGEPLPLLRDLLAFVAAAPSRRHPERGLILPRLFVEVKDAEAERPGVTAAVVEAISTADLIERSAIGSFRSDVLITAAKLAPELERHHIVECLSIDSPDLSSYVHAVNCGTRHLEELEVERVRGEGIAVNAWTVNESRLARRLASWGVDGIISDDPALMRETIDEG